MLKYYRFVVILLGLGFGSHTYSATFVFEDFEVPDIQSPFITVSAGNTLITRNEWNIISGTIDLADAVITEPGIIAYDGEQAVDLNGTPGPGTMETNFDTVFGELYELTFRYSRNGFRNITTRATMQVDVIGASNLVTEFVEHSGDGGLSLAFDDYQLFSSVFTADSTDTRLRFTGFLPSGGHASLGIVLDAIDVHAAVVPIPTAVWLFGSGIIVLVGMKRKSSKFSTLSA